MAVVAVCGWAACRTASASAPAAIIPPRPAAMIPWRRLLQVRNRLVPGRDIVVVHPRRGRRFIADREVTIVFVVVVLVLVETGRGLVTIRFGSPCGGVRIARTRARTATAATTAWSRFVFASRSRFLVGLFILIGGEGFVVVTLVVRGWWLIGGGIGRRRATTTTATPTTATLLRSTVFVGFALFRLRVADQFFLCLGQRFVCIEPEIVVVLLRRSPRLGRRFRFRGRGNRLEFGFRFPGVFVQVNVVLDATAEIIIGGRFPRGARRSSLWRALLGSGARCGAFGFSFGSARCGSRFSRSFAAGGTRRALARRAFGRFGAARTFRSGGFAAGGSPLFARGRSFDLGRTGPFRATAAPFPSTR